MGTVLLPIIIIILFVVFLFSERQGKVRAIISIISYMILLVLVLFGGFSLIMR